MSAFLKVDGISKRFRGLIAVDRLSFEVPQGGVYAVIGPRMISIERRIWKTCSGNRLL